MFKTYYSIFCCVICHMKTCTVTIVVNNNIKTQQITCSQHVSQNYNAKAHNSCVCYFQHSNLAWCSQLLVIFQILEENGVSHGWCFFLVFRGPMFISFGLHVNPSLGQAHTCTKVLKYSTEQNLMKTKTDYLLLKSCLYFPLPNRFLFTAAFYTKFSIADRFHYICISFKAGSTESTGRFISVLNGSWFYASRRLVHCQLQSTYEFYQSITMPGSW